MHISPEYFLDRMSVEEAVILIGKRNELYMDSWEKARWGWFFAAAAAGAKVKKPSDLISFDWEKSAEQKPGPSAEAVRKLEKEMLGIYEASKTDKTEVTPDILYNLKHGKV